MLFVLAVISSFPPISTDLYLPALPGMVESLGTTRVHLNMTLSLFFVFFAGSILFWGPMTDKYGRKPILAIGLVIYVISSALCALANDVTHLIVCRVFQAIGGGAATSVATAVVKDYYIGEKREQALALIMSLVIAAPVVAPLIGGFLLRFFSWHAIFWALGVVGVVAFALSFLLSETLDPAHRYQGSLPASFGRLAVVMKNPGFSILFFVFSALTMPLMGFVAGASYIYIQGFGLSEQAFSYFFTFNALCAMAGPAFSIKVARCFSRSTVITACYLYTFATGILMVMFGGASPILFALLMGPATLFILLIRPITVSLMLDQQEHDTGSASALINSGGMIMGSIGIFFVSTDLSLMIPTIGVMQIAVGAGGVVIWLVVRNRSFIRPPGYSWR